MSSTSRALALLLDAPLQSWGDHSRFNHRGTASFPSKSGVIGILAAALGINKFADDEAEKIRPLAALSFAVARLPRVTVGGKQLPSLRLLDYHTVGAAYDREDPWEIGLIVRNAEGKPKYGHTEITRREYLLDARFVVVLEGDASTLQVVQRALENPRWGVWLGRKSCPPAIPLRAFLAPSREEAFAQMAETLRRHETRRKRSSSQKGNTWWGDFDRVEEITLPSSDHDRAPAQLLPDQPRSFGERSHNSRAVRHLRAAPITTHRGDTPD
jgi:CRISPR system Cascade subunit CasD